jgi:hypothetical protein
MTKPRARHTATNILWALLCAAVIPVTSAAAQSSEPGARIFSRVQAVSTTAGIVLARQDLAALVTSIRIAETIEVHWPGKSGQVTSVRMSDVLERAQFEIARRLSVQPASARHLIFLGDVKLIQPLIERALVEELRGADLRTYSPR